jgi:hypothetical protein
MKIAIYQPHHDQSQKLTPEFQGVLNPNIDDNDWHIQNYLGVCKIAETQKMDYWGTFNSDWQNLIPGYSANDIINHVNENPDNDVYVFTAFSFLDANIYNVWEQGQWCHPEIIKLASSILNKMGYDPDLVKQPMTFAEMSYGQCIIGNKKFWDGWCEFLDKMSEAMFELSDYEKEILNSNADKANTKDNYVPYLVERMLATYLLINRDELSVMPHLDNYEKTLGPELLGRVQDKYNAVADDDQEAIANWVATRRLETGCFDWATYWRT